MFLDYYNLSPLLMQIHAFLCSVMPEWLALTLEGLVVGVFILVMYAVLAIILIYMERKVCAAFQCRIGPNRVGGKGGLLQVPADVLKILTKEIISLKHSDHFLYALAPFLVILASILTFSCLPWNKGGEILHMNIGIFFVLAASSIGVLGILLAGWSSNSKYTLIGAVRSGAMIISYELSIGLSVLTIVVMSGAMDIQTIVERSRTGVDCRIPHRIFGYAFRILLSGRILEPVHYGRYCHYIVLGRLDALAHCRTRRTQHGDGLYSRIHLVCRKDFLHCLPAHVDSLDLPPIAYRPGTDTRMEIPDAALAGRTAINDRMQSIWSDILIKKF